MKKNEGNLDRTLRIILGIGVLSMAFVGPKSPWAYIGVVPLLTGALGWCPIYTILGFKTCKVQNN